MAKLNELLTEQEMQKLNSPKWLDIDLDKAIADTTVSELSDIGLYAVIPANADGTFPQVVLPIECLRILHQRAFLKNLSIS